MKSTSTNNRFAVIDNPTDEEMKEFEKRFDSYNMEQTNGEYNSPEEWLSLVLRDKNGNIVGGIQTSTLFWAQYLEVLWVDERFRRLGYGRDLIEEAERLARENGCLASQTYTFSWQGGNFYQAVGYKLIATYDGYVEEIKEYILSKPLHKPVESRRSDPIRFKVSKDNSEESKKIVQKGLGKNFDDNVADILKRYPHLSIGLIIKNQDGKVIGGLSGYSSLGTMNIASIWVDEKYRNKGYGKDLMVYAEKVAKERECISLQSACFTFQNLDFMFNYGFEPYGLSDVYPKGEKEYYLIKRFKKDQI
ncbi:MAG: GNAT family N-acetyltransferase [Candidatus Thorarchaeota archaeon]|nr:GNAT family N-acetyltransferase [Candidatus Thorarchaeota archaeon]